MNQVYLVNARFDIPFDETIDETLAVFSSWVNAQKFRDSDEPHELIESEYFYKLVIIRAILDPKIPATANRILHDDFTEDEQT